MPEAPFPPSRPFAVGRTAEVYAVSSDEIVKVLKAGFDDEAELEAEIAARLDARGVPAPRFLGLTRQNDRPALRYERIDGPSMLGASVGGTVTIQLLEALLAIVPIFVLTRAAGLDLGSIYARVGRFGRWHVLALVVFVGLFVVIGVRAPSYIPIHGTLTLDRYIALAPALLVMVLSNGFEEEFLFRGLFLKPLGRSFGVVWANVLQALVFAYAHLGVTYVPSAILFILVAVFPLGLVAGHVMRKSDGVVAPALLHAALDIPIYLAFLTFVS
jgi:membrane protease YdiL (CAAX protease family)